jgi:methionyl-tRNA formyltransferase
VAFFGLPLAALLLDRDGHDVVLAALSRTDTGGARRLARRLGPERVWVKPELHRLEGPVRQARPDLLVSWFWTTLLPPALLDVPRLGSINAHPSLLPRHRGPDPTYWAIVSGDDVTGVTIHRMTAEYDEGPILAQRSLPIDPSWSAWRLAKALDRPSLALLRDTVRRLAEGELLAETPQDPARATQAPFPDEGLGAIRWGASTEAVLRQIRALSPSPGAFSEIEGALLVVLAAERVAGFDQLLTPGEGVAWRGRAIIRTGDGAVALCAGEIDGRPATEADFATLLGRAASPPDVPTRE